MPLISATGLTPTRPAADPGPVVDAQPDLGRIELEVLVAGGDRQRLGEPARHLLAQSLLGLTGRHAADIDAEHAGVVGDAVAGAHQSDQIREDQRAETATEEQQRQPPAWAAPAVRGLTVDGQRDL